MFFKITTFGCRVNAAESISWIHELEKLGYIYTENPEKAKFHIINSCAVTHKAEREARKFIGHISRNNNATKIILTGCAATYWFRNKTNIKTDVDLLVPNNQKRLLIKKIQKLFKSQRTQVSNSLYGKFLDTGRLIVKVQDGCRYFCSYCIIPYLRGLPKSISINNVITYIYSVQKKTKVNEVILSGINLGLYGEENNETFAQLVKELLCKTKIKRISYGSLYPENITEELLELYQDRWKDRLTKYFHIPIQSGSNKILKLMKRRYSREEYEEKIRLLKKRIPNALVATDVIIGFCGERDSDFESATKFFSGIAIDKAHVFKFSQRKGTLANILKERYEPISNNVVKKRSKTIRELFNKKFEEFQKELVGSRMPVLIINKIDKENYLGILQNNITIKVKCIKNLDRDIFDVTIDRYKEGKLYASLAA